MIQALTHAQFGFYMALFGILGLAFPRFGFAVMLLFGIVIFASHMGG